MDLVIGLLKSKNYNIIFTIYYRLSKDYFYYFIFNESKNTFIKVLAEIFLYKVY